MREYRFVFIFVGVGFYLGVLGEMFSGYFVFFFGGGVWVFICSCFSIVFL